MCLVTVAPFLSLREHFPASLIHLSPTHFRSIRSSSISIPSIWPSRRCAEPTHAYDGEQRTPGGSSRRGGSRAVQSRGVGGDQLHFSSLKPCPAAYWARLSSLWRTVRHRMDTCVVVCKRDAISGRMTPPSVLTNRERPVLPDAPIQREEQGTPGHTRWRRGADAPSPGPPQSVGAPGSSIRRSRVLWWHYQVVTLPGRAGSVAGLPLCHMTGPSGNYSLFMQGALRWADGAPPPLPGSSISSVSLTGID
jgi:hypothetical protein